MTSLNRSAEIAALAVLALLLAYAIVTIAGLLSLQSPELPIADPYFTAMELLILILAPALVWLMILLQRWAPEDKKHWATGALVFMAITAGMTSAVHFSVLVLTHAGVASAWLLSFRWPSVAYALDILAWDVFFSLSAICTAFVFTVAGMARWARLLFLTSGVLSGLGLAGVAAGDMQLRNIGVLGYAGVFPLGVGCFALLLRVERRCSVDP